MINLSKVYIENIYKIIKNSFVKYKAENGVEIKPDSKLYDELLSMLETYLSKMTGVSARYVSKVLKKDYLRFLITNEKVVNNYCYLSIVETSTKPLFYVNIIVNNVVMNKDLEDEQIVSKIKQFVSLNIKDILYSIYQEIIRFHLVVDFNKVRFDRELLNLCTHILSGFILKIFGKKYSTMLSDEKIKLLNMATTYIIYVYYLKFNGRDALKNTLEFYKDNKKYSDVYDNFKQLSQQVKIVNYTDFKQFGSLLDTLGILDVAGTRFISIIMSEIGVKNLFDILSSYPSLICNFIIANYPVDYISKKMLIGQYSDNLNEKLEKYVNKKYM